MKTIEEITTYQELGAYLNERLNLLLEEIHAVESRARAEIGKATRHRFCVTHLTLPHLNELLDRASIPDHTTEKGEGSPEKTDRNQTGSLSFSPLLCGHYQVFLEDSGTHLQATIDDQWMTLIAPLGSVLETIHDLPHRVAGWIATFRYHRKHHTWET